MCVSDHARQFYLFNVYDSEKNMTLKREDPK